MNSRAKALYPKWNGSSNLVKYFFEPKHLLHWKRPFVCTDNEGKFQLYGDIGKPYSEAVLTCRRIDDFEDRFMKCLTLIRSYHIKCHILGWFTAYLAYVLLTKLQGQISARKPRDHINPQHVF